MIDFLPFRYPLFFNAMAYSIQVYTDFRSAGKLITGRPAPSLDFEIRLS